MLEPLIKNKNFIDTLSEEECLQLVQPYIRKRINDPELKEVVTLLRSRHKMLYNINPERITKDRELLELFEKYKTTPTIINELDKEKLDEIINLLKRKTTLAKHIKKLRKHCYARISYLTVYKNRLSRANVGAMKLYEDLNRLFDIVCHQRDRVYRIHNTYPQNVQGEIKAAGRLTGLAIYDLPIVITQLFSINALINIYNKKSLDNKVASLADEHFWSLYTYAGPKIVERAIIEGNNYNIRHLVQDAYGYNQTAKTTKKENTTLSKYHEQNELISPQISYNACNIGNLIYCPREMESEVMMKWRLVHDMVDLEYIRSPHKPFQTILTLDRAIDTYPHIANVHKYLKI